MFFGFLIKSNIPKPNSISSQEFTSKSTFPIEAVGKLAIFLLIEFIIKKEKFGSCPTKQTELYLSACCFNKLSIVQKRS